jgi:glutaredoxin
MKTTATFYHAGCPVCLGAEQMVLAALDRSRYEITVVHLGTDKGRIDEAAKLGVKSVPALVLDGAVYHINFGASLADLR